MPFQLFSSHSELCPISAFKRKAAVLIFEDSCFLELWVKFSKEMEISLTQKKIMAFRFRKSHTEIPFLAGTRCCLISEEMNLESFHSHTCVVNDRSTFSGSPSIIDRKFIFYFDLKRLLQLVSASQGALQCVFNLKSKQPCRLISGSLDSRHYCKADSKKALN